MTYFGPKAITIAMALIINELLCYMLAKIDSVPTDTITRLVNENFTDSDVEVAKILLCEHVDPAIRAGSKRGQNKKKNNLDDIVKMIMQCDRSTLPKFVAYDLSKLPPISIDCIDVSSLMRKQQLQDVEIASLKDLVHEILTMTADTSRRLEVGLMANSRCTSTSVSHAVSDPEPLPSVSPGEPAADCSERMQATGSAPTYSEVLRDAVCNPDCGQWTTANRKKSAKMPASRPPAAESRKPADAAPRAPSGSAATQPAKVRSATNKAVVGCKKAGPFTAVSVKKRVSMFMSRLPPGTGGDAVRSYVMEQTGADDVTATKLQTRYDSYESYRLDIVNPSCGNILDPDMWGQGLIVRRFFTRRGESPVRQRAAPGSAADSGAGYARRAESPVPQRGMNSGGSAVDSSSAAASGSTADSGSGSARRGESPVRQRGTDSGSAMDSASGSAR